MGAKELNDAFWSINGRITECDKCASREACYEDGKLIVFNVSSDYGTVSDYDHKGAHATLKGDETCPRKTSKEPKLRTDCYFYHESQDMNAYVPNCLSPASGPMFGSCPCSDDCKYYINNREAQEIARKAIYNEIDKRNRLRKLLQSAT